MRGGGGRWILAEGRMDRTRPAVSTIRCGVLVLALDRGPQVRRVDKSRLVRRNAQKSCAGSPDGCLSDWRCREAPAHSLCCTAAADAAPAPDVTGADLKGPEKTGRPACSSVSITLMCLWV